MLKSFKNLRYSVLLLMKLLLTQESRKEQMSSRGRRIGIVRRTYNYIVQIYSSLWRSLMRYISIA